jgi:hypothetical protein
VALAARRATPALAAVTAVVAVIVLLLVLNSRPSASGPGPGAVAEHPNSAGIPSATPVASTPSTAPAATPQATQSSSPPVTQPPVSQPPATQPPAQTEAARLPVTVLNNSRHYHLAAQVAARLSARGWPIRKTGNFTGRIVATTVYYAPGQRASAQRLAREFAQIRRVEPRFRGLPGTGLTLVVTRDWSS